jgi:hypothetical protein
MLKELIKVANSLDAKGFHKEADALDKMISKTAVGPGQSGWFDKQEQYEREKRKREQQRHEEQKQKEIEKSWDRESGQGGFGSGMKPKEEPSMMDVAVEEEASLKKQRAQDKIDKANEETRRKLQETVGWFQGNIFVSKVDKFPVATDKDYMYSNPDESGGKGYIVPAGTVFEDLDGHGTKRDGSSPFTHSLRTIYEYATGVLKRLNKAS